MRSIKDISGVFCGEKLKVGRWYKIRLKGEGDDFWLIKFWGFDSSKEMLLHEKTAFIAHVNRSGNITEIGQYPSGNGNYHGLCWLYEIDCIEGVSLEYVEGVLGEHGISLYEE